MRSLHFQPVVPPNDAFSLDFPDDYTVSDIMDILADREELNRASMRLTHRNALLAPGTLVKAIKTTQSDPILLSAPPPIQIQTAIIPSPVDPVWTDEMKRRLIPQIASNPSWLESLLHVGEMSLDFHGRSPFGSVHGSKVLYAAEADALLRQYTGLSLAEAYAQCLKQPSAFTVEPRDIGPLEGFWHEVFDRMSAFDRKQVGELTLLGMRASLAVQLYMAAGKDLEVARAIWQAPPQ
jgi:hypothetical protein